MTANEKENALRVAYFCMESIFSYRPLAALLDADADVRLVMRPVGGLLGRRENLLKREGSTRNPIATKIKQHLSADETDPFLLAERVGIPRWTVGNASTPAVVDLLRRERIELIVIAFFNQLLQPQILQVPAFGAINAHPSLLPDLRGPSPLFWTFQQGMLEAGLTVHQVAAGEDDGGILLQERISLKTPLPGEILVDLLAEKAALTIVQAVNEMTSGTIKPTPQNGTATRAPRPSLDDLKIDPAMGAERIFRFVRGVGRWTPPALETSGAPIRVVDAIDILDERKVPGDYAVVGDHVLLGTTTGTVVLRCLGS
ncbi:MAG: hypothetical protein GY822_31290 [Deltaproteobacteria bacterium]|nr:hypothetical protein [Deltaproteobacteria bacterium]